MGAGARLGTTSGRSCGWLVRGHLFEAHLHQHRAHLRLHLRAQGLAPVQGRGEKKASSPRGGGDVSGLGEIRHPADREYASKATGTKRTDQER